MPEAHPNTRPKDGADWLIGGRDEVAWITEGTSTGLAITAAIPPVFADYATLELPATAADDEVREHDRAVVALLCRCTVSAPWWLGYLETGSSEIIFASQGPAELRCWNHAAPARRRFVPRDTCEHRGSQDIAR
jgi:hypothetical protein